jgi:Flp pilus assembly protein TadG
MRSGRDIVHKPANDKAQVTIMTALAMAVLLGLVAFATDIGLFLIAKRQMQTAADSAAMAGAAEINYGDGTVEAQEDSAQNGFTDGVNGVTVAVHSPPSSGPHAGGSNASNAGYVEVIVSQSQPTIFMKMLSRGAMVVSARAVATNVPAPSCVDTMSPSPPSGFGVDLSGGADLALTGCGLTDDATGGSAFKASGGITLTASFLGVVGSTDIHNGASIMGSPWPVMPTPPPVTGITPINDPLSSLLTAPPSSEYTSGCANDPNISTTQTIGPGTSTGYVCYKGLTITNSPTVTLNPGLYIIDGEGASAFSFSVSGGATVNGMSGVTFYFVNNGSFTFSNGATMNLTAPTISVTSVGINAGILFYQDSGDTAADMFEGGSSGTINGIFYLPAANLTFQNGSAATFSTDLVVGSLTMSGAGTLTPYAPLSGASPLSSPRLVE